MPEQRYDANRQTIGTLLSTTSPRIEVPEWQRSYSWGSDEIEAFWHDLLGFEQAYPGNNIDSQEYFLGSAVLVTGGATNLLLDGQQRLATATILLSALRDARRQYKADAATRLQSKYISDHDDATGEAAPVITLNIYDRDFFRSEVQEERVGNEAGPKPRLKSHGLVRKARQYFAQKVADEESRAGGGEEGFKRNLRLSNVLCNHMSLVIVYSSDEDNAATVFETLNDRGIGLSTPDLLRNLLMRRAKGPEARQRVVAAWQTVLSIADETSVDEYLRHFWVSQRGDVKARKLYREIKSTITQEQIESVAFSAELEEAAPLYRDLAKARDDDEELKRLLEGIRMLGAKVTLPALLAGYSVTEQSGNKSDLRKLAGALTTLYVRHTVIGGRESTALESRIYSVAAELRKDREFGSAIAKLREFSPDAEEFTAKFSHASISRISTARYLLRELEHARRETQEVAVELSDRVHVEHIYPQNPIIPKWDNHAQLINRIGNLTLLGKRLNTSIKNGAFETKKVKAYADSDILLTRDLLEYEAWGPQSIECRQRNLASSVARIWSFPGESVSAMAGERARWQLGENYDQDLDELPEMPS
ncbi:DUF262 domain-containing protein [Isoptericola sediminis]|uniref:DUF262 domain-containing protein n=1 Tax=Isoptericola sediminis TaxID=2733572 RepID=A0A849JTG9_9MICO|nr:DUF262 domain-containing protein [Isoptericola sediminis]NNU26592.1 DUF262 domain-containing protein [Isoptericola sediminis]